MSLQRIHGRLVCAALVGALVASCTVDDPLARHRVPEGFEFVRDDADLLDNEQEATAEGQLREIARNFGVFGVVMTGPAVDDGAAFADIAREVLDVDGELLAAFCAPDDCDLTAADVVTPDLEELAENTVPAPEPVGGNPDAAAPDSLRAWVEFGRNRKIGMRRFV